jgi:hypothetical protein
MKRACVALLALAAAFLWGCSRHETAGHAGKGAPDSARASTAYENPAAVPHPCPPQPTGPQIGKSDSLVNAIGPRLMEWVTMWRAALPGFAADSLWRSGSSRWAPAFSGHFEPLEPGDLTFTLLGIRSPDGRYTLDVDWYQSIQLMGDSLEVGGDPDAKCLLVDNESRAESVLLQTGAGGGYHWGAWLSRTSFVVGGWGDADDYGQWQQGHLWVYSIPDSTVAEYVTRIVSSDAYSRYQAGWHAWLMKRYRALKRSTPRA